MKANAFTSDVVSLCALLADLIEAGGSKRPTVTKAWLTDADRLLRVDERPVEEAQRLVRWCQANDFWRANVLSMRKFREKYDTLRLQAQRGGSVSRIDQARARHEELERLARQAEADERGGDAA